VYRTLVRDASAQAVAAGVMAGLLGYASSVAVVVAGLTAVGATPQQVGSALLALGVAMGVLSVLGSVRHRLPVAVVWSTPGMALLATVGPVEGGLPVVLGAFLLCGALVVLTGLIRPLARALQRLPAALSAAVLAGVLLPFCLAPVRAVVELPLQAGAIVLAWLVAMRWAPRLAGPVALLALVVVVGVDAQLAVPAEVVPRLDLVTPGLSLAAVTSLALPLYLVTMAAQNLVGLAVLSSQGYRPPVRSLLVGTGAGSMAIAPFVGPTVNLAAITGALTAGPGAHPDPGRRGVAGVCAGLTSALLGVLAPFTSAIVTGADPRLVATAAGLALLGAFAGAAAEALRDEPTRPAAAVTLLVAGSGIAAGPLGAAPLGLLAGAVLLLATRRDRPMPDLEGVREVSAGAGPQPRRPRARHRRR
jgi:benzoate membrane transport protein